MLLLFATVVGPIFFFLLVWVAATVYRLYFPERPLPFEEDPVMKRKQATEEGQHVPVGLRDIRADQRHRRRQRAQEQEPDGETSRFVWHPSGSVPETWYDDLWQRRN
jgi:hypothetical protein